MAEDVPPSTESQPYQALYRRYRPRRFADVRGQEPVSRALLNAVREDRVAHAYLFSGPRGTGKTSTARILAMALNCEAPVGGEPDGTCASCTAIRAGSSMDVFELDAASNRKLDEMRDLLSRVALGTPGRWKVYIIDEVHQLTSDAASALLKTLEEPPSHVVFVLATTDPQKVLPTILSRTQHFEFRLLDGDLLTDLLSGINQDAGLGLTPEAVELAVRRGRGSARDAESALEQLAAAGGGEDDGSPLVELVDALAERDVSRTLQAVASAIAAGREPRRLGSDLVEHLRNAFLAVQAPSLVLLPGAVTAKLAETASQMGLPFLVRSMEVVGQAMVDMRDSVDPRITLEVALIRLASPAASTSLTELLERVERLERATSEKGPAVPTPGAAASPPPATRAGPVEPGPAAAQRVGQPAQDHQSAGPAQARVALGAYMRGGSPPASSPSASSPSASPPSASPPSGSPPSGSPPSGSPSASATSTASDAHASSLPSRDELTKVWGDALLDKLSRPAKVYMASGRFVEVKDGAAVFALPDAGLLARANNFLNEAEGVLTAHFGRPVPLRLVLDGTAPTAPPGGTTPGDDETYDLDDVADIVDAPTVPAIPAEERILQAFPGSVIDV
ncbi:MAG TPA: DNA polymerase III subunit gamma/tau [Acidimicrobiales bacterium]|nr:DNA polymerase III subunit gamma/tau [Acidimicrobiales bacterium]